MIPSKEEILKYPMFPKYDILELFEEQGKTLMFKSAVYIHLDMGHEVQVFKVPVRTQYKTNKKKVSQEFIDTHLLNCYKVGKYMRKEVDIMKDYPMVDTISKLEGEHSFEVKLYTEYL